MEREISALIETAKLWSDLDYPPRQQAIADSLDADNRFTAEAIHFAVNQQMHSLANSRLRAFQRDVNNEGSETICVLNAGNVPFVGLSDMLTVWLLGHEYIGVLSSKSPFLLPAFAFDLLEASGDARISFGGLDESMEAATVFVATGSDPVIDSLRHRSGSLPSLLRGTGFAAAILTGSESDDQLDALAEDVLLHEGMGCRNVSVLWVSDKNIVDRLTSSLIGFRQLFPAHRKTIARIQYERKLLQAAGIPHIYSDDDSFIISRGDPVVQSPGHLRLCVYDTLSDVENWAASMGNQLQLVVCEGLALAGSISSKTQQFGRSQRNEPLQPPLDDDLLNFLKGQDSSPK